MAVNDEVMFGIYNELGLVVGNSKGMSISELESITDMIANPKKVFCE